MTDRVHTENENTKTVFIDAAELREKLNLPAEPVDVKTTGRNVGFVIPKASEKADKSAREGRRVPVGNDERRAVEIDERVTDATDLAMLLYREIGDATAELVGEPSTSGTFPENVRVSGKVTVERETSENTGKEDA